jgi:hypothetical protein
MSTDLKMPTRESREDGPITITKDPRGNIIITHEIPDSYGSTSSLRVTPYNAWRVLGLLSVFLGLPLSAKANKAIKL